MLQEAQDIYQEKENLEPQLKESNDLIQEVKIVSSLNAVEMKKINDSLSRLGEKSYEEPAEYATHISDLGKLTRRYFTFILGG